MSVTRATIGNEIASRFRNSTRLVNVSDPRLQTVADLLSALERDPQFGMFRTTGKKVADFLNVPLERLAIDDLIGIGPAFSTYLEERHYSRNSVRSYRNYAGNLLRKAKGLGWSPPKPEIPDAWKAILMSVAPVSGCSGIVHYAISEEKMPSEFNDDDLDSWGAMMLSRGRTFAYVRACKGRFRRILSDSGHAEKVPGISHRTAICYGVPLRCFPAQLRDDITALLDWKQAAYSEGRSHRWKLREVSAKGLKATFERLYGFTQNLNEQNNLRGRDNPVSTVVNLVTKESISAFCRFLLNVRKVQGTSVIVCLASLYAALKQYPNYKSHDFSWFEALISEIQPTRESDVRTRKEAKSLPYEVLVDIADTLHKQRTKAAEMGARPLARLVHNELLLRWMLILPWRQLNLRQCGLGLGSKRTRVNLFKETISPYGSIAVPRWATELMSVNPQAQVWQYQFSESETKNGREVRSILPRRLVPLLEEYLELHRPVLLSGPDPGTLFVSTTGRPFDASRFPLLVGGLTLRYAKKRITPHRVRDAFAFWWLRKHPEDYLTVSKKLWHRNLQTTLNIYGCKFDEAQADCHVEEYVESGGQD
jgi:integrase